MAQHDETRETTSPGAALDARVEAQTLYLMEMMHRVGASPGAAQAEADGAARIESEALCAACGEQAACAAFLASEAEADAPPAFCANGDFVRAARRDH